MSDSAHFRWLVYEKIWSFLQILYQWKKWYSYGSKKEHKAELNELYS